MQTSGKDILPNFYLIGAAKSGTTSLFELLAQHPQVYTPFVKEPTFFNNDANYSKGLDWYIKTYFKKAGKFPARGEATPHYLFWGEKVAPRLKEIYGQADVKFIVIFRDPVYRAYSQYWMDIHREVEWLECREALAAEEQRLIDLHEVLEPNGLLKYAYFRGGCYASLLQPFLQLFQREQFHFLFQDDLKTEYSTTMKRTCEFLGISTEFEFQPVSSNSSYVPRNRDVNNFILYRSDPIKKILRKFAQLIPEKYRYKLRKKLIQSNRRNQTNPPMEMDVERSLRHRFKSEIEKLEAISGRDLSHWVKEIS